MIKIGRAHEEDAYEIVRLNSFVQSLHAMARPDLFKPPGSSHQVLDFFRELLADPANYFYLASLAQRAVGYIWAELEHKAESPLVYRRSRAYIHHLAVDEGHRKTGVGSALIKRVEALATEVGLKQIALDTWSFNEDARRYFERQGFEVYNVRMWKDLS